MRDRAQRLAIPAGVALAAGVVYAAIRLFGVQLAAGDVYPEYSSLRSDPAGSKLLFDSLAAIENVKVARNFLPLEYLPGGDAAILFLAMPVHSVAEGRILLERAAERGDRLVLALHATVTGTPGANPLDKAQELEKEWHVKLETDPVRAHVHHLYFGDSPGWRAIDTVGSKVLAMERDFGKGSVVLMAESDDFDNQSSVAGDRFRQVSAAIGRYRYIVFDEEHLGIAAGGSVMEMARRFRLSGMVLGLLLVAVLALWRNAAGFPPPAPANSGQHLTGRTSQAGLLTLLRRHIRHADLTTACWQEWLHGNRGLVSAERRERAEEIVRTRAGEPLAAAREIASVLHAKGEL